MAGFEDRKKAWEQKINQDSEFRFKVEMRRNKLLGQWAAELLGLEGDDAEAYIKEVVESDLEEAGDDDVVRKVRGDFEAKGVALDETSIRAQIEANNALAAEQIMAGE